MYLHLGRSVTIPYSEVVGIFDLEITSQSKRTLTFLETAQRGGRIESVTEELPKSFVVCKERVYLSQLSPSTLVGRAK